MKKSNVDSSKHLIVFLILLLAVLQTINSQVLKVCETDSTKMIKINKYTTDYNFSDGLLSVFNNETKKWGFIDEKGNIVLDFKYLYGLSENSKTGYFNSSPHFTNGLAWVNKLKPNAKTESDFGLYILNKQGVEIETPKFDYFSDFVDGFAFVSFKNKSFYINDKGQEVFKKISQFSPKITPRPFVDGLAVFYDARNERCGYFNKKGEIIVPAIYLNARDFNEGLAAVLVEDNDKSQSRWGFIDVNGNLVIPAIFNRIPSSFCEGFSSVVTGDGSVVMINKKGKVVSPHYRNILDFKNGYAIAHYIEKSCASIVDTNFQLIKETECVQLLGYNSLSAPNMSTPTGHGFKPWELPLIPDNTFLDLVVNNGCVYDYLGNLKFFLRVDSEVKQDFNKNHEIIFYTTRGYEIDFINDKIMHCKTTSGDNLNNIIDDGFIDFDGRYIFKFTTEDF